MCIGQHELDHLHGIVELAREVPVADDAEKKRLIEQVIAEVTPDRLAHFPPRKA